MILFFCLRRRHLGFFLRWSINLLALVIAGSLIKGINMESLGTGIIAAGIFGVVNCGDQAGRASPDASDQPPDARTVHPGDQCRNAYVGCGVGARFCDRIFSVSVFRALIISLVSWGVNVLSGEAEN